MSLTRWRDTGSDFSFGEYRIFTRAAGDHLARQVPTKLSAAPALSP